MWISQLSKECTDKYAEIQKLLNDGQSCNATYDDILCWPPTAAGSYAILRCPLEFNGIHYSGKSNATKYCDKLGQWTKAEYMNCNDPIEILAHEYEPHKTLENIYLYGKVITIAVTVLTIIIQCSIFPKASIRNKIHLNLWISSVVSDFIWLLDYTLLEYKMTNYYACTATKVIYNFSLLAYFSWTMNEAIALEMLLSRTFQWEQVKLRPFLLVGYGTPTVLTITWIICTIYWPESNEHVTCPLESNSSLADLANYGSISIILFFNACICIRVFAAIRKKMATGPGIYERKILRSVLQNTKTLLCLSILLGVPYLALAFLPDFNHWITTILIEARAIILTLQSIVMPVIFFYLHEETNSRIQRAWQRVKCRFFHQYSGMRNRHRSTVNNTTDITRIGPKVPDESEDKANMDQPIEMRQLNSQIKTESV